MAIGGEYSPMGSKNAQEQELFELLEAGETSGNEVPVARRPHTHGRRVTKLVTLACATGGAALVATLAIRPSKPSQQKRANVGAVQEKTLEVAVADLTAAATAAKKVVDVTTEKLPELQKGFFAVTDLPEATRHELEKKNWTNPWLWVDPEFWQHNLSKHELLQPYLGSRLHDGNLCAADEEELAGLCYKKCSNLTNGEYPVRSGAWSCCHEEPCSFFNSKTVIGSDLLLPCNGYDVAGDKEGNGCPTLPGGCMANEELNAGLCYKKCAILTKNEFPFRCAPDSCGRYASHLACMDPASTKSDWKFDVGGGEGDPYRSTASEPHPLIQNLTERIKEMTPWQVEAAQQAMAAELAKRESVEAKHDREEAARIAEEMAAEEKRAAEEALKKAKEEADELIVLAAKEAAAAKKAAAEQIAQAKKEAEEAAAKAAEEAAAAKKAADEAIAKAQKDAEEAQKAAQEAVEKAQKEAEESAKKAAEEAAAQAAAAQKAAEEQVAATKKAMEEAAAKHAEEAAAAQKAAEEQLAATEKAAEEASQKAAEQAAAAKKAADEALAKAEQDAADHKKAADEAVKKAQEEAAEAREEAEEKMREASLAIAEAQKKMAQSSQEKAEEAQQKIEETKEQMQETAQETAKAAATSAKAAAVEASAGAVADAKDAVSAGAGDAATGAVTKATDLWKAATGAGSESE